MSPKYLVAAILAAAMAAPLGAQSVKAGIDAWQRADYSAAIAIWRPLAEAGDADAQFNLGQAYRLGRGVPLDLSAAKVWFERAARAGHLDAETTLGLLVFQNGDRVQGLKWLKQAADQGEPRALLVVGTALFNGDGVPQDRVLGYAYVSRSAAQGLAPAQDTLAQLDQLMSVTDRQKGAALARSIPSGSPVAATAKRVRTAQAKPTISKPPTSKASRPWCRSSASATSTSAGLARNAIPRPASSTISLSLAPSPMPSTSSLLSPSCRRASTSASRLAMASTIGSPISPESLPPA